MFRFPDRRKIGDIESPSEVDLVVPKEMSDRPSQRRRHPARLWTFIAVIALAVLAGSAPADAGQSGRGLGGIAIDDLEYLVNNLQLDIEDIVTAPLHIADADSPLRSPRFYLGVAGAGALWGASYALDQTMRSRLHDMSPSDARLLEDVSYAAIGFGSAATYAYGVASDNPHVRRSMLTGGEAAGVATLANALILKPGFGRLRPYQDDHSHSAFFRGGQSFVSGDVTPVVSLAAGISNAFDNRWYVAAPVYSVALMDGIGRMGNDAHWFSDVVGAGLLGWGTTELFEHLHRKHEEEPSRWRILPMAVPIETAGGGTAIGGEIMLARRW